MDENIKRQALAELAKRELARRQGSVNTDASPQQNPIRDAIGNTADIIRGGFMKQLQAGPVSFNTLTGGPATEFAHGVKSYALEKGGVSPLLAEAISSGTDPQSFLMSEGVLNSAIKSKPVNIIKEGLGAGKKINALKAEQTAIKLNQADSAIAEVGGRSQKISDEIKSVGSQLKAQTKSLSKKLVEASDEEILSNRPKIASNLRSGREAWGDVFDKLIDGKDIPAQKILDARENTIKELLNEGIQPSEATLGEIDKFIEPFKNDISGYKIQANDVVNFRRNLSKSSYSTGYKNTGAADVNDVTSSIFQKNLGRVIEEEIPGVAEHNQSYKDIAELSKFYYKNFKPRGGEYDTKTGTNLLARVAKGEKVAPSDVRAIETLKKGTEYVPGVGDFNMKSSTLADIMSKTQKDSLDQIMALRKERSTLEESKKLSSATNKKRLVEISRDIALLTDKAKKARDLAKLGLYGAYGASATGVGSYFLKRKFGD